MNLGSAFCDKSTLLFICQNRIPTIGKFEIRIVFVRDCQANRALSLSAVCANAVCQLRSGPGAASPYASCFVHSSPSPRRNARHKHPLPLCASCGNSDRSFHTKSKRIQVCIFQLEQQPPQVCRKAWRGWRRLFHVTCWAIESPKISWQSASENPLIGSPAVF